MTMLNRDQVALCFGAALTTVDSWIKEGCPAAKVGREWEFDSAAVHRWLTDRARAKQRRRGNRFGEGDEAPDGAIKAEEAERRTAVAKMITAEMGAADALMKLAPIELIKQVASAELGTACRRILAITEHFQGCAHQNAASAGKAEALVSEVDGLIREALAEIKCFEWSEKNPAAVG